MGSDGEKLLLVEDSESTKTPQIKQRIWGYMVLVSSVLSFALGTGFNLGIAGSIAVAQSRQFNISLDAASWTISVHTVFNLQISK